MLTRGAIPTAWSELIKPYPRAPQYRIGDDGIVYGINGRARKLTRTKKGYMTVGLCLEGDGRQTQFRVHRLVLETFVGLCPDGMEACHRNGDPGDNKLSNLRWDTHENNMLDAVRHGTRRPPSPPAKPRQPRSLTRCQRGHAYTPDNVIRDREGKRRCRTCKRDRNRERYLASKQAA